MKGKFLSVVSVAVALGTPSLGVAQTAPIRQPLGIYYRLVTLQSDTDRQVTNNVTAALTNSAIAGILAVFSWDNLNPPFPPSSTNTLVGTNDFRLLDDVFGAVEQWNAANPTNIPKTIQLEITPGFHTPSWVLSNLVSCDPMFQTNSAGWIVNSNALGPQGLVLVGVDPGFTNKDCGCANFLESESKGNPHMLQLPLPWNRFYKNTWATFIQSVAGKYGTNPVLVSVAVTGPTSSSAEMILPNETNDPTNYLKWNPLFALEFPNEPGITNSDIKFIKAWEDAIDLFGNAFSNLTLTVTTGSGLPDFLDASNMPTGNYSVPPGFCPMCADTNKLSTIMDCAAETTILAYFVDPQHGGNNAKAVQEDHLSASGIHVHPLGGSDLGVHGPKWLAQNATSGNAPLPGTTNIVSRVLGGLQVGGGGGVISQNALAEGCNERGGCPTNAVISPEQAIYNVLITYFDGTPLGSNYGTPPIVSSNFPLNYLQIYYDDVIYANTNTTGSPVGDGFNNTNNMTAQMLFSKAALQIAEIAKLDLNIQAAGQNVFIRWLASVAATQLQVNHNLSNTNGWKPDTHTTSFTNGFYQISLNPNADASFFRLATPLIP